MIQGIKIEQTLNNSLMKTLQEMKELFDTSDFLATIKCSKSLARSLVYLLKSLRFRKQASVDYLNSIKQCLKIIVFFMESAQYEKHGQAYPFYSYITKNFKDFVDKQNYTKLNQSILGRMDKNEASLYYRSFQEGILEQKEPNLNQEKFKRFISALVSGNITLPNSECVCCSSVFLKNSTIHNTNPLFSRLLGIHSLDQESLEKLLNSIVNQNGGVIIIGAKKVANALKVQGLQYKNQQDKVQAIQTIKQSIIKIKPKCRYLIQQVPVLNYFFGSENLEVEYIGICFRASIFPHQENKLSFLQTLSKSKMKYYETKKLGEDGNPVQIKAKGSNERIYSVYTEMHKKYYMKSKSRVNCHQNILCFPALHYNTSNLSSSIYQKDINVLKTIWPDEFSIKQESDPKPQFKYPQMTLLIFNPIYRERKGNHYVLYTLRNYKGKFELKRAFPKTFKPKGADQSVWVISHEIKSFQMCVRLKNPDYSGYYGIFPKCIRLMAVYKILKIKQFEFSIVKQKFMERKFKRRYEEGYHISKVEILNQNNQKINFLILTFCDFEQAIYGFMIMEELKVKGLFIKQK